MKKVFVFLLITTVLFIGLGKSVRRMLAKRAKEKSSYHLIDVRLVKDKKPFVVIIPSYNNESYVEKNLESVLSQKYDNYRVIYIDDASTDLTYSKAIEFIEACGASKRVEVKHNEINQKALANLYFAIHSCKDDEICILLDGDDFLANDNVLNELNRYYNDPNVWLTYGQYVTYPAFEKGICREPLFKLYLKYGNLRKVGLFSKPTDWFFSHLRTFYAGLFKQIRIEDLKYEGQFFSSAWDLAMLFPMVEMAREHAVFIPTILYVYNRETPLNDDKLRKEEQYRLNLYIRSLSPYSRITQSNEKGSFGARKERST